MNINGRRVVLIREKCFNWARPLRASPLMVGRVTVTAAGIARFGDIRLDAATEQMRQYQRQEPYGSIYDWMYFCGTSCFQSELLHIVRKLVYIIEASKLYFIRLYLKYMSVRSSDPRPTSSAERTKLKLGYSNRISCCLIDRFVSIRSRRLAAIFHVYSSRLRNYICLVPSWRLLLLVRNKITKKFMDEIVEGVLFWYFVFKARERAAGLRICCLLPEGAQREAIVFLSRVLVRLKK